MISSWNNKMYDDYFYKCNKKTSLKPNRAAIHMLPDKALECTLITK